MSFTWKVCPRCNSFFQDIAAFETHRRTCGASPPVKPGDKSEPPKNEGEMKPAAGEVAKGDAVKPGDKSEPPKKPAVEGK